MWNNYPDGMRESDIPGWNEYDLTYDAVCNAADVDLGFVDLDQINSYITNIRKLVNNEFIKSNTPDLQVVLTRLDELQKIIVNPKEALVDACPFEGEVEAVGEGKEVFWACPWCQTEHQDELPNPNE